MNIEEIKARIPHRPPFLWLDEVKEISEEQIVAVKQLAADEAVFAGHYPEFPVFPGVLQCEACFQAGALLISQVGELEEGKVPVVTRQNNTQFRKLIRPGDTMEVSVQLTEKLANAFFLKGKVTVDGKVTCRLEFVCATADIG